MAMSVKSKWRVYTPQIYT